MDREVLVYAELNGVPTLVGRLWARTRKNKEDATFEYDAQWLEHRERFSLEPALPVRFTRRRTRRCSAPSAIRPLTGGGAR
jgi:hypothetical protein